MGIPVRFRSNHPLVIERASAALGHWNRLPEELLVYAACVSVDIVVQELDSETIPDQYEFLHRYHGDTYLASHGENLLTVQRSAGKGIAFVTRGLLDNESAFAWFVVEALALLLVTWSHRVPVHAAAVTKGDRAIAFLGRSGAGKSTLTYACLQRGFGVLSEDAIYVGTESDYRIWGNAAKVHLMPDASNLFPELRGREPRLRADGRPKIAVSIADIDKNAIVHQVRSVTVCLIEPNHVHEGSSLEPVTREEVREVILSTLEPGFDIQGERVQVALDRLLSRDAYRLSVGHDLGAATELLTESL